MVVPLHLPVRFFSRAAFRPARKLSGRGGGIGEELPKTIRKAAAREWVQPPSLFFCSIASIASIAFGLFEFPDSDSWL